MLEAHRKRTRVMINHFLTHNPNPISGLLTQPLLEYSILQYGVSEPFERIHSDGKVYYPVRVTMETRLTDSIVEQDVAPFWWEKVSTCWDEYYTLHTTSGETVLQYNPDGTVSFECDVCVYSDKVKGIDAATFNQAAGVLLNAADNTSA